MKQILKTLNALVAPLAPSRINEFGDFHAKVHAMIGGYLKELGLVYSTWFIILPNQYHTPVCQVNIDFVQDKRVRWGRKGQLKQVWFTMVEPFTAEMTLPELIKEHKRLMIETEIQTHQQFIDTQSAAIDEAINRIAALRIHLKEL